jgi:S1-C subfamily serine protease
VNIQHQTPEHAASLGLADVHGALVTGVVAGSPAEKAGVKVQDVIVGYNGRTVIDSNALRNQVASTAPGTSAELKVLRDGRTQTLTARVTEREATQEARRRGAPGGEGEGAGSYGMTLSPLTPQLARRFEVAPSTTSGVVVTDVDPNGPAASAGVRPGDVIKRVNGKEVASIGEIRSALTAQSDKPALVMVTRGEGDLFVALPSNRS